MQNRYDSDISIRQPLPIDEMSSVSEEETLDPELGWNGFRGYAVAIDLTKGFKQAGDIAVRLFGSPMITSVAINFVETIGSGLLNEDS